jgi:hypothetical protein
MQSVLSRSLAIYQDGHFRRSPKKITIHKNTPFKEEELLGALDSFRDGTEVELVQIVKGTGWKGVRFDLKSPPQAHNCPVERGTYFPLTKNETLLWTQGSVQGVHVTSPSNNVYKEGAPKPTPSPGPGPAIPAMAAGLRHALESLASPRWIGITTRSTRSCPSFWSIPRRSRTSSSRIRTWWIVSLISATSCDGEAVTSPSSNVQKPQLSRGHFRAASTLGFVMTELAALESGATRPKAPL